MGRTLSAVAGVAVVLVITATVPGSAQTLGQATRADIAASAGTDQTRTIDNEPTEIRVHPLARGGKFLGDDIGGAQVTLRDARSGEVLASGRTRGGSGSDALMTAKRSRTEPVDRQGASVFAASLQLDEPRFVDFEVYGPLGAPGAATRVTVSQWVLPGTAEPDEVVIEVPGLNVQILDPPTHFLPAAAPPVEIPISANVTMMCGCPIDPDRPWKPDDFVVAASVIEPDGGRRTIDLRFDADAQAQAPSQFVADYTAETSGIYRLIVTARQKNVENTGSAQVTFVIS